MDDLALPALASRLAALASPVRLRILLALRDGALCVCQLAAVLDVPASTVSSHLADLRHARIVGEIRKGRFVWYTLHRTEGTVPWLRLVARQAAEAPQVVADHARAARIRLVPPEMVMTSTGCSAPVAGARETPGRPSRGRPCRTPQPEQPTPV
jgi:ArsR family transcriptional regulator, arsenate/arsenite/antimonite-responsive transcriptional repressor